VALKFILAIMNAEKESLKPKLNSLKILGKKHVSVEIAEPGNRKRFTEVQELLILIWHSGRIALNLICEF
jgi:hypothetical protein